VESIPLGLKAACSSWTQAAKPALSDSGPMGANPKLKVLSNTFSREHKVNNKYSNKQLVSLIMWLFFCLQTKISAASKVRNISLYLDLVFGKPFQINLVLSNIIFKYFQIERIIMDEAAF
jgi:hypothetical protein